MCCYKHLTIEERESILVLLEKGLSVAEIGRTLSRSASTVSRELLRNGRAGTGYSAAEAQNAYSKRRKKCRRKPRLDEPETRETVEALLDIYWSPEQICERLRKLNAAVQIGTSTVYRGIWNGLLPREFKKKLRTRPYHKPSGSRTGKLTAPHSIHERPKEANDRSEIGHWESDTVRGSRHSGEIATQVDRKSRLLVAIRLADGRSVTFMEATIAAMKGLPVKTFTTDNGKEFAAHEMLTKALGAEVYFCDPAAPGQRGANENTNGLLRQFFPKRRSFEKVSQSDVDKAVSLLNNRPRKCLNWETPLEVFSRESLHLG
jgi:transposase, IS30 family